MIEDTTKEQPQSILDAQVERFVATYSDLRRVMGAGFKRAHQQGFSATQFMVMGLMEKAQEGEPLTIGWIAGRLGINPATVVRTVDSLEKRGLVQRRRDQQDRRQVFVEFMEAGREARQEMKQRFKTRIRAIFVAMSEEGRASLLRGLEEFVRVGQGVGEDVDPSTKGESDGC
jgi:MarR family transcriptional regulator, organic hydroperoxide resistance regulator